MAKALYRAYRPKTLAEVIGQEHITTTLSNALKKGAISHAYLFTGPRGTGKTSTARILAHEVNGLPYKEGQTHLDIIEIDAASNRRIDEIRELRERVHTAPSSAKYKVYIIDEVHMLTKEAFNALLKTLEEPPEHAIFILATTEAHKLPETIISRTQRFTFKPVDTKKVSDHLRSIAESEELDITDEALELITKHGDGSFRDSISLLDQTRNIGGTIGVDEIARMLGMAPEEAITNLWQAIEEGSAPQIVQLLSDLRGQGYQSGQLAKQLAKRFRQAILEGTNSSAKLMHALKELLEVPVSHDADTALELVLLGLVLNGNNTAASHSVKPPAPTPPQPKPQHASTSRPAPKLPPKPAPPKAEEQIKEPIQDNTPKEVIKPQVISDLTDAMWQEIVDTLRQKHKSLYSVIRMANVQYDDTALTLKFKFSLHQKQVNDPRNKQILLNMLMEKTGKAFTIQAQLTPKEEEFTPTPITDSPVAAVAETIAAADITPAPTSATLSSVMNVFGGGEVLES